MVDITKYPYFSYNHIVDSLFEPISHQTNIQPLSFGRRFPNKERVMICNNYEWAKEYYIHEFYRYGLFERDPATYESGFHMWDHLGCDPNRIYEHMTRKFDLAHGLTIVQQHGTNCDIFLFTTSLENTRVNNFYLNNKELFTQYINNFYETFDSTFHTLSTHTTPIPVDLICPYTSLSKRQQDCAHFLIQGLTTKEIAKNLCLSPRTIDEYIDILKNKFKAKNRIHLSALLQKYT